LRGVRGVDGGGGVLGVLAAHRGFQLEARVALGLP
jgi:hypothetical protein